MTQYTKDGLSKAKRRDKAKSTGQYKPGSLSKNNTKASGKLEISTDQASISMLTETRLMAIFRMIRKKVRASTSGSMALNMTEIGSIISNTERASSEKRTARPRKVSGKMVNA